MADSRIIPRQKAGRAPVAGADLRISACEANGLGEVQSLQRPPSGEAAPQRCARPRSDRYLATNDRTVSIGISMTRSPSGERMNPWHS